MTDCQGMAPNADSRFSTSLKKIVASCCLTSTPIPPHGGTLIRTAYAAACLMAGHLLVGLLKHFTPLRLRRRQIPRQWRLQITQVQIGERRHRAVVRDQSASGLGLLISANEIPFTTPWLVQGTSGQLTPYRPIYRTRLWGLVPRVGLQAISPTFDS